MELSNLCGVEAAMVIFLVEQLFRRYKEIPVMERSKKMLNQENFLRERITKIRE
ncbi:hypothetical protein AAG906_011104 [Vitis piasezkii]